MNSYQKLKGINEVLNIQIHCLKRKNDVLTNEVARLVVKCCNTERKLQTLTEKVKGKIDLRYLITSQVEQNNEK
ncbi:hypothetical protein ACFX5K_01185 [Rickettsiales bacterium LUAb2]